MIEKTKAIGFAEVEVIDTDLGASASIGSARQGFKHLISEVAMGHVGAVVSREVSRLSRTDKTWCHLLEVCQVFDTLILDEERVYDLSDIDDQLVLGIKGTLSVVELKVLRMRMLHGRDEKARRGELRFRLPPGFIWGPNGHVEFDPDQRVREAIALVFKKFRELWSTRQVFIWFKDNNLEVPVNKWGGGAKSALIWKSPALSFIQDVLRNPFYAGAYVYGRRPVETTFNEGKLTKRSGTPRDPDECRVFLKDHHEGYIDWDEYERNRKRMRHNSMKWTDSDPAIAAIRSGRGLLGGILRCGHCGRKLHVRYWGKSGTSPRYFCKGDYDAGGNYCLSFSGQVADDRLSDEILALVSPLGVDASLRAIDQVCTHHEDQKNALRSKIEQLDFEVQRAFEQYDLVDPRHRLVAQDLENRWNLKLEQRQRVREALAALASTAQPLTAETEARLHKLGEDFELVWNSPNCPAELKKKIVHTLIEEVTVTLDSDTLLLHFVVFWKGGSHTEIAVRKPRPVTGSKTPVDALEIIRKMAPTYGDGQIAAVLNKSGLRTGMKKRWTQTRVATARRNYSIPGQRNTKPNPEVLSFAQAAKHCDVSQYTIKQLVKWGLLENKQVVQYAPWEIKRADLDSPRIQKMLERLKRTGKLMPEGGSFGCQSEFSFENKGDDSEGYYE